MSQNHPYLPEAGAPAVLMVGVVTVATAVPAALLAQGRATPLWLSLLLVGMVAGASAAVPSLNRRARAAGTRGRRISRAALAGAILVPLCLLVPAFAVEGAGWLLLAASATQVGLLVAVSTVALHRRRHDPGDAA